MKKHIILLSFSLLLSVSLYAQNRGHNPELRAQRMVEHLSDSLSLEPVQKDSLVTIFSDFYKEMQQNRAAGDREKMKAAAQHRNDRMKQLLTEEQYAQFEKLMKERRGRRGKEERGHRKAE